MVLDLAMYLYIKMHLSIHRAIPIEVGFSRKRTIQDSKTT
jgi:hypothetical protein